MEFKGVFPYFLTYFVMTLTFYYLLCLDGNRENYERAFILGLCVYGTFDLTNYCIFNKYDPVIGLIDIIWGCFLSVTSLYIFNNI